MATVKIISDSFGKTVYNKHARHPMQAWQWGEARVITGNEVVRIGEFDKEDTLTDVYQFTLHPIPMTPWKIAYLPRSVFPSPAVLKYLREYAPKYNIIFVKIEPYVRRKGFEMRKTSLDLRESPHGLFPEWTQMLELGKTEDELLSQMKSKTRYNVRLAEKKGVIVRENSTEAGFREFADLYFETCRRQQYYGHSLHYHKTIWEYLHDGNIAHILTAYYEGKPLASFELFFFHDTMYYTYGGTSVEHRNVMAANLLMWEAIRLGKKRGAKIFDMWGSLPPGYESNHPWAGFTRFKEGYGTEFVHFIGSFDLVVNPLAYSLYNRVYTLRHWWLSRKR